MWIQRDISEAIEANQDPIQILRGPRQCGKSSLFMRLNKEFHELSLDDPALRELAQNDPEMLLNQYKGKKLLIDEVQYAPKLFPSLKRRVDLLKRSPGQIQTLFRLTGSNQILMDRTVKESLAGRASFFDMNTLSVSEILESLSPSIQEILYKGGWPEIYSSPEKNVKKYLDDYINSYIEKDIVLTAGIQKSREFLKVVRLLAGRVGQLLELKALANEAQVESKTVKEWISILERMHIVSLVQPFFSNRSKRLIKSPKIYFIDTGLACRLQGWTSSEAIITSPLQGSLFENLVFTELYKLNQNYQLGWEIFHWRTKEKEEIDFVIQVDPDRFVFLEAKVSPQKLPDIHRFHEITKVFHDKTISFIQVHQAGDHILNQRVPIAKLKQFLFEEKLPSN